MPVVGIKVLYFERVVFSGFCKVKYPLAQGLLLEYILNSYLKKVEKLPKKSRL